MIGKLEEQRTLSRTYIHVDMDICVLLAVLNVSDLLDSGPKLVVHPLAHLLLFFCITLKPRVE